MGIAAAELAIQRRLTLSFIAADSLEVVLMRSVWEDDGAGGSVKTAPAPLAPQVVRLIPRSDGATPRLTNDGEQVTPSYALMGTHEADIERWDEFLHEGHRYEVVFVNENRQYEVKAEVAYRG